MKKNDKMISGAEYQEFLAEIVNLVQNHRALAEYWRIDYKKATTIRLG